NSFRLLLYCGVLAILRPAPSRLLVFCSTTGEGPLLRPLCHHSLTPSRLSEASRPPPIPVKHYSPHQSLWPTSCCFVWSKETQAGVVLGPHACQVPECTQGSHPYF
ncbi:hypothetical protein B0O80DRAFT_487470, partial [Mortierella sp. GBAus27b]